MTLELLEALSLPGDAAKPNEDSFAHLDRAALVLDGATPLGPSLLPGPSDAAWIAQFGARRLAAHLKEGDAPDKALAHALEDAARSFIGLSRQPIREKWQTPCASMMLVSLDRDQPPPRARSALAVGRGSRPSEPSIVAGPRASEDRRGLKFLWFGDCAAIVQSGDDVTVVGESLQKRREEAARAKRMAETLNLSSAAGVSRPEIEPLLRAARNRINSGRNWLFSPDPRAANHVARQEMAVKDGDCILLASDGFLALVSDYGLHDPKSLLDAARQGGLAALGKILRATEDADPAGETYARFKKSDDATAVLLRVG
jgi:serine/threonine protein phosphatase PrpC